MKDVGLFLNKTKQPCTGRGLDSDRNFLLLVNFVFLGTQRPACLGPLSCLTQNGRFHPVIQEPESGTILGFQPARPPASFSHLDWFSGPCSASAIPSTFQLPPPTQPLGCPVRSLGDWLQRRMETSPLPPVLCH